MQILKIKNSYSLSIDKDEALLMQQCLNEVLHGLVVENFEEKIGSRKDAFNVMGKIEDLLASQGKTQEKTVLSLIVSSAERMLCRNSIDEVCKQIEDWEFSLRVGGLKKDLAKTLLRKFEEASLE